MYLNFEIEIDEINYTVEASVEGGTNGNGYDEAPAFGDIEIWSVCNESGCELVDNLSQSSRSAIEDKTYELYSEKA